MFHFSSVVNPWGKLLTTFCLFKELPQILLKGYLSRGFGMALYSLVDEPYLGEDITLPRLARRFGTSQGVSVYVHRCRTGRYVVSASNGVSVVCIAVRAFLAQAEMFARQYIGSRSYKKTSAQLSLWFGDDPFT